MKREKVLKAISIFTVLRGVWLAFYEFLFIESLPVKMLSVTWSGFFIGLSIICIYLIIFIFLAFSPSTWTKKPINSVLLLRSKLGWLKWLLIASNLLAAVIIFQYTPWGGVFYTPFTRFVVWISLSFWVSFLLCEDKQHLIHYNHLASGFIIAGSFWITALNLRTVTDFPFSLSWSEGNRIWDYSIPFGRNLYDYPPDQPIFVYTDLARRLIFGLPFLLPHPTIELVRGWIAVMSFLPYAILGWLVLKEGSWFVRLLGGLWLFAFLYQGGVYAPLMIAAILVVLACWYVPLWLGIPMLIVSGYCVSAARIHWMIAPVVWVMMLSLLLVNNRRSYSPLHKGQNPIHQRVNRTFLLTLSAAGFILYQQIFLVRYYVLHGFSLSKVFNLLSHSSIFYLFSFCIGMFLLIIAIRYNELILSMLNRVFVRTGLIFIGIMLLMGGVFLFSNKAFLEMLAGQSLLWYRLLPNPTNPLGILFMLCLAVLPLAIILLITYQQKQWVLPPYGMWLILFCLGVFFVIGIIVSVKIGGGNNLHNMDLFMITWVLTAGVAWRNGLGNYVSQVKTASLITKTLFFIMLILPFIRPLQEMRPLDLPPVDYTIDALNQVRIEVEEALPKGEVLFIDQRQLLTFGYVKAPLVVEYEKKLLQDRALSANQTYFQPFYDDLAERRFSLIISSPLKVDYKQVNESGEVFGEENNAWTQWVAEPLLRYYQPRWTFKKIGVQVLVPLDK